VIDEKTPKQKPPKLDFNENLQASFDAGHWSGEYARKLKDAFGDQIKHTQDQKTGNVTVQWQGNLLRDAFENYTTPTPEESGKGWGLGKATAKLLGFDFPDIQVAYLGPGYEKYEGKSVHEIAKEEGESDLNTYLKLCEFSNFKGRVNMGPYSTPEVISEFEHNEHCLYMTDAWVEEHGIQNPAIYDCFPKFLRDSLLGTGDTMPKTIRRMTGATADRFMLKDRGYLKEGYYADLTVFNEEEIRKAVPDQEKSFGIEKVMINGQLVLSNGHLDEDALKTTGRAIPVAGT
jgi:N-acyl-D-amino-acid deacylase